MRARNIYHMNRKTQTNQNERGEASQREQSNEWINRWCMMWAEKLRWNSHEIMPKFRFSNITRSLQQMKSSVNFCLWLARKCNCGCWGENYIVALDPCASVCNEKLWRRPWFSSLSKYATFTFIDWEWEIKMITCLFK